MSITQSFYDDLAPRYDKLFRDYDALPASKPLCSPPYIHPTERGQSVAFQTWHWAGENYRLIQYILDDGDTLQAGK